jgi:hypothetical protein
MVVSCVPFVACAMLIGCGSGMSREDRTYTSASRLRVVIHTFVAARGRPASDIEELIRYEPVVSTLNDGWGNRLVYQVESSRVASITSLGKDKRVGGSGQNADLLWSFALKDSSGNWIGTNWGNGALDWLSNPF